MGHTKRLSKPHPSKEKGKKQARNQLIRDLILAKEWRKVGDSFEVAELPPRLKLKIFFLSFDLIRPKHKAQTHVKSKDDASNPCSEISNLADGLIFLELFFFFTSFSFRTMMS